MPNIAIPAVTRIGSGPPVVLVHGTCPAWWGELPAWLAASTEVLTYDRRGFGTSRGLTADGFSAHACDLAAVIGDEPAVVVGWSMGGVVALEAACAHPERFRGLVLIEPPLHAKRSPDVAMASSVLGAMVMGRLGRAEAGARWFLRWAFTRTDGEPNDLERLPVDALSRLREGDNAAIVGEIEHGTGEHLELDALRALDLPVTVLHGTASRPAFAAAARRIAGAVPSALLETVEGSGHVMQLDAPDRLVAAVRAVVD